MQASALFVVLCFGAASAAVLRAHATPELKCGPTEPWSKHTPFEPKVDDHKSMCQACKIRACNSKLPMPGEGGEACRCQYSKTGKTYMTDCKPPFAKGVKSLGGWSNCPGGVRDCKALEGQCVSATFKMDSAPEPPSLKKPDLKCGPTEPWSKHTPFEPDVKDHKSMCQACKIRACNSKLPMPGDGGEACRCQYLKTGETYMTDCKPPFAKGVKSLDGWTNCPGGVRDCKALEGQCVSATFKMDSAPKPPSFEKAELKEPELKCGPTEPWSKHAPFEPDASDHKSMCQACKIRACNSKLPMPGDGGEACRCQYLKTGDTYMTDCKPPFAKGVKSLDGWTNCPGGVRDCKALEGQCVSATFKMDSAPKPPSLEEPELKEPELKCGPTEPWSKHAPFEPDINDHKSMCQACKIRACNSKLPMPGEGGEACRCQYLKTGDTYMTDCKPPFAKGVKSLDGWTNCPGGVRDCKALEGQCVSATFKMDSAQKAPWLKKSGAVAYSMISLVALALCHLA